MEISFLNTHDHTYPIKYKMQPIQWRMREEVQGKVDIRTSSVVFQALSSPPYTHANKIFVRYLTGSRVDTSSKTLVFINCISSHKTQSFTPREKWDIKISRLHGYLFSTGEIESLVYFEKT